MEEKPELSDQEFKINMIIMLKVLMEKVLNMQKYMGNASRQVETKKESKASVEIRNTTT